MALDNEEFEEEVQEPEFIAQFSGALRILSEYPEFKYFEKFAEQQIRLREKSNSKRINGQDGLDEHNFQAGEISGIRLMISIPRMAMEAEELEKELQTFNKEKEEK